MTRHSTPWEFGATLPALDDDVWELYDTNTDWCQAHDLAEQHPDELAELQRLFLIEAVKYGVLPLDDRRIERFNSDLAGRPVLVKGNDQILYGGMHRLSENSVINLKNKSHSVTAEVDIPKGGANGVIIAQGGAFAGWSLYLHEGKPKYCHNLAGLMRFYVEGTTQVPAGKHQVRMEFAYDGGGLAKGGTATLFIDGKKAGDGRLNATVPMIYSGDETCDVGRDIGTPVSEDYTSASQPVHRHRALGRAARRRRQPRPPDLSRRAHARRHDHPVTRAPRWRQLADGRRHTLASPVPCSCCARPCRGGPSRLLESELIASRCTHRRHRVTSSVRSGGGERPSRS